MEYKKVYFDLECENNDKLGCGVWTLYDDLLNEVASYSFMLENYEFDNEFFKIYEKIYTLSKLLGLLNERNSLIIVWAYSDVEGITKELENKYNIRFIHNDNDYYYIWTCNIHGFIFRLLLSKETEILYSYDSLRKINNENLIERKRDLIEDITDFIEVLGGSSYYEYRK